VIILDEPYVSRYLLETIITSHMPVLKNETSVKQDFPDGGVLLNDAACIALFRDNP